MNATQFPPHMLRRFFLILTWGLEDSRRTLVNDLIVAGMVTVMLIPQSVAYGLLAGAAGADPLLNCREHSQQARR